MYKRCAGAVVALLMAVGLVGLVAAPASAHSISLSGVTSCLQDGRWQVKVRVDVTNTPSNMESETKAINPGSGLSTAGGSGVMAGNQVMLNAWYEHRNNWPGVQTRKGNYTDYYTITVPANQNSVSTMVQIDWKGWKSEDPTKTFTKPGDCKPTQPQDETQYRDHTTTDCKTFTSTKVYEKRTRSYVWDGNSWEPTAWSEWTQYKTETVSTDPESCRPNQPDPERETRDRTMEPDCEAGTVTTVSEERTREWTWNSTTHKWVLQPWSDWTEYDRDSRDATVKECPPCEDDVCDLPVAPDSQGDVVCDGALSGGVYDNVTVRQGDTCVLVDVYINGSVKAVGARNLLIHDATIRKNVLARGVTGDVYMGSKESCRYDPLVGGTVRILGSHNVLVCDMTVCEDVIVKRNDGRITLRSSQARRFYVQHNNKWSSDGKVGHRGPSVIRLLDLSGPITRDHNQPRTVLVRR